VSWQRVRGHDSLVEAFSRVVQRGRLAHAYFFAGPSGVGKRLFAGELAKALLCEARSNGHLEACGRCTACLQVAAGTHPDFFVAARPEEALEFPIEVVRELCQSLAFKPARGHGKVAIVDDADDLNAASANSFLKTLEEPPPGSTLLLIGTSPELQLPTILSRCQVVHFAPLPVELVKEILLAKGVTDEAMVERLARMSGGSVGQALALAEQALWEFRRALLGGLTSRDCDTVGLAQAWMEFVEEAGKESAAQRRRAALVLRLLIDFLEAALHLSAGGVPRLAEPEDLRALEELVKRVGLDQLLALLDRCLEADLHIDRRVQLVLVLEALLDALGQKMKVETWA
jgi:DNA polymerase-3 subunit delta'